MRKYTLVVSVLAHLAVVCAVLGAPLLAAAVLPSIHDRTVWVEARITPPPRLGNPDAPRDRRSLTRAASSSDQIVPASRPESVAAIVPLSAPPEVRGEGDPIDPEGLRRFEGGAGGDSVVPGLGNPDGVPEGVGEGPPAPPALRVASPVERVGGRIRAPAKVHHVAPVYPRLALAARTQGSVVLEAVIAEDGSVRDVRVLKSIPLLDRPAMDAVRQWRFTPTILNDKAVSVLMSVTVQFFLE